MRRGTFVIMEVRRDSFFTLTGGSPRAVLELIFYHAYRAHQALASNWFRASEPSHPRQLPTEVFFINSCRSGVGAFGLSPLAVYN